MARDDAWTLSFLGLNLMHNAGQSRKLFLKSIREWIGFLLTINFLWTAQLKITN